MSKHRSATILVIDDEVTQRMLVKEFLEAAGYQVRLSEDGRHGVRMATTTNPDLVIVDAIMPSLDGYTICRRIRSDPKTTKTPIILITASKEPDAIARGLQAGATDFITKPVEWQFLADRIGHVLAKTQSLEHLAAANASMREELRQSQDKMEQQLETVEGIKRQMQADLEEKIRFVQATANAEMETARVESRQLVESTKRMIEAQLRTAEAAAESALRRADAAEENVRRIRANAETETAKFKSQLRAETQAMREKDAENVRAFWHLAAVFADEQLKIARQIDERTGDAAAGEGAPSVEERLRLAGREAKVLLVAINDFRTLARYQAGAVELSEAEYDLGSQLSGIAHQLKDLGDRRGVYIETHLPAEAVLLVGDEQKLRLLIVHILLNAIRHSAPGAMISLGLGFAGDQSLIISCMDRGSGIPADVLGRLRGALDQAPNMLNRKGSGLGVGLPIASAVAKLHGGRLEFHSELDQGTTVTLILPPERARLQPQARTAVNG